MFPQFLGTLVLLPDSQGQDGGVKRNDITHDQYLSWLWAERVSAQPVIEGIGEYGILQMAKIHVYYELYS